MFMLSCGRGDDWNVHLAAPTIKHTSDGVQSPRGPQVPLSMFGGPVAAVIDARWNLSRRRHRHRPDLVADLASVRLSRACGITEDPQ